MTALLSPDLTPERLKTLSPKALPLLADEIRRLIIDAVPKTGGHLASSLGAVELAIALHFVFDAPRDRLLWDIGHQAYAHKLLTGRVESFAGLRTAGGISGFPNPRESRYDAFVAGHAGNSLSAALGLALAQPEENSPPHVVAVVGDGALTSGMAFEALNHAGDLQPRNLIVVLNDNGMSIAPCTGALARFGSCRPFFEALGFDCRGPIAGHDFPALLAALTEIKSAGRPAMLHVKTIKGKGLAAAEAEPVRCHAIEPAGTRPSATFTSAFGAALLELAARDSRITAVTAGMRHGTGLEPFRAAFPSRFFDAGICEQHAVTLAAGLAAQGLRPVCAIYSSFLQRAVDQVIHDTALPGLPVVFAVDRAGLVGADGPTHQGAFDLALLRAVPNLSIMAPADGPELGDMLFSALLHDGPSVIRYPRAATNDHPPREFRRLCFGRGDRTHAGKDGLLIGLGAVEATTGEVRRRAAAELGLNLTVINARFVKPLDVELLSREIPRYAWVATLEEHARLGGFGSAVLELVHDKRLRLRGPLLRFGLQDRFVPPGTPSQQREWNGCTAQAMLDSLKNAARGKVIPMHRRARGSALNLDFRKPRSSYAE